MTPTASSGPHYVECDFTRNADNAYLGTVTSNVFQVIDDTSNQDDATIVVGATMNLQEAWGTVTIDAIDLDPGQEYTLDWVVEDHSLSPPTVMMQNDHIWVAGNDGTYTYELEFHDLAHSGKRFAGFDNGSNGSVPAASSSTSRYPSPSVSVSK